MASTKGKKKGIIIDGVDTTPMKREQLQVFALKIKEENEREREERNFFQMERDKLRTFWEITRNELEEAKAKLRNKDRQIENERQKNHDELKFYKQKVKHFQFENLNKLSDCKAETVILLKNALTDHDKQEIELLSDKHDLKHFKENQEYAHQEQIKSLKMEHSENLRKAREEFHQKIHELEAKYEKKFDELKKELNTKHKMEMWEVEERKGSQIDNLTKTHAKAYNDMKNYYNDITLNNMAVINRVKSHMESSKKQNAGVTKQMKYLNAENQLMLEPLKTAVTEITGLKRQLKNYAKDKMSLANTAGLLRDTKKKLMDLTWSNEVLEIRHEKLQIENDELKRRFVSSILEVQQKTSLKTELLTKRIQVLKDALENRKPATVQLKAEKKCDANEPIGGKLQKMPGGRGIEKSRI